MPAFIDLTGQIFGRLTVLKLHDQRDEYERLLWECRCECGNETTALGQALKSGHKTRCGHHCSLPRLHFGKQTFRSGKVRESVRKTKRLTAADGKVCLSPREAAQLLKVSVQTLWYWEDKGCPYGRLEARELEGFNGRGHTYYTLESIEAIKNARSGMSEVPEYPGLVPVAEAKRHLGVSERSFKRLTKKYGARSVSKKAKVANGCAPGRCRVSLVWYVPVAFVEAVEAQRKLPEGRITDKEAAAMLGIAQVTIWDLVRRGELAAVPSERRKNGRLFVRAQVEVLRNKRAGVDATNAAATMPSANNVGGDDGREPLGDIHPFPVRIVQGAGEPIPVQFAAAKSQKGGSLSAVERAIQIFLRDPNQSMRDIAGEAGCHHSVLSRDEQFKRLRESYTGHVPNGSKAKDGRIEAESDD